MKLPFILIALIIAPGAFGQKRFSWQNACFMNPRLPYCAGHDFLKRTKPVKGKPGAAANGVYLDPQDAFPQDDAPPSVLTTSAINWRFADPHADALATISFSRLEQTPVELGLLAGIGAHIGLNANDMAAVFDAFSGVDQVALSLRDGRVLIMVTGYAPDAAIPPLEVNWKTAPVKGGIIIGRADDVDQAVLRIADDGAVSELARLAGNRQANGALWAAGSGDTPEIKRFTLAASMRERLASDLTLDNSTHLKISMEADEIEASMDQIALTPLGKYVGALVDAGRYVPRRDPDAKPRVKPTIHGLDGNP